MDAPAPSPPRPKVNKWLVTVSVTFGTLMGAIDASIVNVAIPHIRGTVGATLDEITWITTGFVIATVLIMPLTAFLGRLFGQKRVYMSCLMLFLFGSALCGLARGLTSLVAARVLQGFGAGALQPTEQAILRQTFPPEEQGMAMALFGLAVVLGPAFGPTLGGWITDNYSWPWIFYINLPVGTVGLIMVSRFVHEPEDITAANRAQAVEQRKHMDWAGIALLTIGLSTLQYVLEEGNRNDWFQSRLISGLALVSLFALCAFVLRELTAKVPAVNLRLFKDPVFTSGTLIAGIMFAQLLSITFLLPLFMQELLGFTATESGLALMPRSLVMAVGMPIVGRLYNRVSPRLFVALGIVTFAVSAYKMSHYNLDTTARGVVDVLIIQGAAFSFMMIPLTTAALSNVPRPLLADATGLNSLIRQIGASIGIAVYATLIGRYATTARASMAAHLDPGRPEVIARLNAITQGLLRGGHDLYTAKQTAVAVLYGQVAKQATVLSFDKLFLLSGISFLCVLPLVPLLRSALHDKGPQVDVHVEV